MRISWSFFAGALGAWVISTPSNYAFHSGWIGLSAYALYSGLPALLIAYAGDAIRVGAGVAGACARCPSPAVAAVYLRPSLLEAATIDQTSASACSAPQRSLGRGAASTDAPRASCCCAVPPPPPCVPAALQTKMPHVQSLTDFIGWRYGWVAKTFVALLALLNMCICE